MFLYIIFSFRVQRYDFLSDFYSQRGNILFPVWEFFIPSVGINTGRLDDGERDAADFLIYLKRINIRHATDIVDDGHQSCLKVRGIDVVLT